MKWVAVEVGPVDVQGATMEGISNLVDSGVVEEMMWGRKRDGDEKEKR